MAFHFQPWSPLAPALPKSACHALGLLLMTGVIQLVVPDGLVNFHLYWSALALAIIVKGTGAISIERQIVDFHREVTQDFHRDLTRVGRCIPRCAALVK